jgi:putative transposase
LRRPIESAQYTSTDYTQTLTDHLVLGSIGTVGDAYDNALAESFVDSYKTELIADRVWRSRAELELATVEWVAWFNHDRLHGSLGDIPPVEFEALHAPKPVAPAVGRGDPSEGPHTPADERTPRRVSTVGVDFLGDGPIPPDNALSVRTAIRSGRENGDQGTTGHGWPLRPVVKE